MLLRRCVLVSWAKVTIPQQYGGRLPDSFFPAWPAGKAITAAMVTVLKWFFWGCFFFSTRNELFFHRTSPPRCCREGLRGCSAGPEARNGACRTHRPAQGWATLRARKKPRSVILARIRSEVGQQLHHHATLAPMSSVRHCSCKRGITALSFTHLDCLFSQHWGRGRERGVARRG